MRFTRVVAVLVAVAAIAVPVALAFGFDDSVKPPNGIVGIPYNFKYVARNGCPPYSFAVKAGALPPGLSLDAGGTISGTPTTAGSFFFWAELRDSSVTCPPNGSQPAQRPFTIEIAPKLTVSSPSPLAPALVGKPYSVKLTADGGGSQTWSVASGTLPAGLSLATDGTLSGTPSAVTPNPVSFVAKVVDGPRSDTKTLVIDVVAPLGVTPPAVPITEVGHALKPATLVVTGGRGPYTWAVVSGPAWLDLDASAGTVGGTPTSPGAFPAQMSVKDVYGATATVNLLIAVKAKLAVKTTKLLPGKVGRLYRATLRTNGGVSPLTWRATSGKFPIGVRLDRKTGVLSGIPRKPGTYQLTFTVKDALGETSETSLTLIVLPVKKK